MSDADYPALGFDPLPGNPEAVRDLAAAARVFAERMTEQADVLDGVRRGANWTGEAAEAFAAGLEHLPGRLHAAGQSVQLLADDLLEYSDRYDQAKLGTWALEEGARTARAALDAAQVAYDQPVISTPDAPWCPRDRTALDAASDDLGAILREAHRYRDNFEDSVADLAAAIRRLSEDAPDPPRHHDLLGWATNVFELTPLGQAVEAAHDLVNHFPHLFSEFAEVLGAVSAAAAFLAIPCMVVPGLGQALGVIALATSGGAALINTSLYAGHATDENGHPYVTGGKLALAWTNVGLVAGGVVITGGATAVKQAAQGIETSFEKEVASHFTRETFQRAGQGVTKLSEQGVKNAGKWIAKTNAKEWRSMGVVERSLNTAGVAIGAIGPAIASDDPLNVLGIKDIAKIDRVNALPKAFFEDLHQGKPDLHLDTPPVMRAAFEPPEMRAYEAPPKPVMGG